MSKNDDQRLDLICELRLFSRYGLCISNDMHVSTLRILARLNTVVQDTINRLITKEIDDQKCIFILHELRKFLDNFPIWGEQAQVADYENLIGYLGKE